MKEKIKYKYGSFIYSFNEAISFWYTLNNRLDSTYQNELMKIKRNIL